MVLWSTCRRTLIRRTASTEPVPSTASPGIALPTKGAYSIERVLALEEYTRSKSIWHVLRIIFQVPLAPLVVVLPLEMIPLRPVTDEWQANWTFFALWLGVGLAVVAAAGLTLLLQVFPELAPIFTMRRRVVICAMCGTVYMTSAITLAQIIGFPVPFLNTIINPIVATTFVGSFTVVAWPQLRGNAGLKSRLFRFGVYCGIAPLLTFVYPATVVVFLAVDPSYQPLVTLSVPILKLLLKKYVATYISDWEDVVPVMVVFSVEFFHSLFQVICVQTGGSIGAIAIIVIFDAFYFLYKYWQLYMNSSVVRALLSKSSGSSVELLAVASQSCKSLNSLMSGIDGQLRAVRLQSTFRRTGLSFTGESELRRLHGLGKFYPTPWLQAHTVYPTNYPSVQPIQLAGPIAKPVIDEAKPAPVGGDRDDTVNSQVIIETVMLLSRTEFMLLGELVECIVPWIYVLNLALVWISPNAAYYSHTKRLTTLPALGVAVGKVTLLLNLELASMVVIWLVLHKQLRFSPLHQLGYVIEHQARLIQSLMVVYLYNSGQLNLDHVGVDYTFRFKWLSRASKKDGA